MFNASRLGFTKLAAPASTAAILTFANLNTSNNNNSNSNNITLADASSSAAPTSIKLEKVKAAIANLIEEETTKRSDGTALTGTFVRLAWHCSGTYSAKDNSGGSQGGRQRFSPEANYPANAGLQIAREALEPIKLKFPELSYADLYTLAGVVAVEESGGPAIPFRLGRIDLENGESSPKDSDGRLPNADVGCRKDMIQHVRDVFWRMGFCDQEIVALLGAHALGRCHTDASGYWGPWNFSETTMSNEYFRLLIEERWSPKMTHNGEPWTGPDQYEDSTGKLMMLPSDIAMIQDPEFKKYVEMYAKDQELFFKDFAKAFSKLLELGVAFFGGGQPLGTWILMEEDRWTQDLTLALVRYWAAEALVQGQTLALVTTVQDVDTLDLDSLGQCSNVQCQQGMSPRGIRSFLAMIPRDQHLDKFRSKSDAMAQKIELAKAQATVSSLAGFGTIDEGEDFEEEEDETMEGIDADAGLTNAWQYKVSVQRERMGVTVSSLSSSKSNQGKVFCHSFDLGGKMLDQHDEDWIQDENQTRLCYFHESCPRCPPFACRQSRSCAIAFYNSCVKQIGEEMEKHPNTVIRVLIMNAPVQTIAIALPLLLSHVREHALPVVFLTTVRPWLRPPHSSLSTTMSYTKALISLRRTSDAVLTCEGFSAMTLPPPPEFSDLAGILTIRKLALQSLSHFSDTTTNRRPPANRYGMKRDRRKMHIRMLHLPPEDFSAGGSSVGGGARSGAGKGKEKEKAGTTETALQPGMGCSSNQRSRKGSSSTPSLDF